MANASTLSEDADLVFAAIVEKCASDERSIIAIAGPPASGKSTLAAAIVEKLNEMHPSAVPHATLLPMDGYHLDNQILEDRNLLARKGAPETFDAHGFCKAINELPSTTKETFHPRFDRHLDLAIANAVAVHPETPKIVVEGNYLLLKTEPWNKLADNFCLTVFVCPELEVIKKRLHSRWITHGLEDADAWTRALSNDIPNAEMVIEHSAVADIWLAQKDRPRDVTFAH